MTLPESVSPRTMVTAHVLRKIRPGHEALMEQKVAAVLDRAARADGYLGSAVIRLAPSADNCISALVHFTSRGQLDVWANDPATRAAFAEIEPHLAEPVRIEFGEGAAGWFTLPDAVGPQAPPKWKMTIVTWLAIFPTLTVFISASFHLFGQMPMIARLFLNTIVIAPLMTWVIMPLMTQMFRAWLFRSNNHSRS